MKNVYPQFIWWIGVVEDRDDPEKLGRCRVRIYGIHTPDKSVLPTANLPWAMPIQPSNYGATSGIGGPPLGALPGTWVVGFFLDGEDMQQPAFFGTISSKFTGVFFKTEESPAPTVNVNDGIVRDPTTGIPVLDENGNPQRVAVKEIPGWELGQTSERYESGGRGPGVINNYNSVNDLGGASYGIWQIASFLPTIMPNGKSRGDASNSPIFQYLKSSGYADKFKGLTPGTNTFDQVWKELAANDAERFRKSQYSFIYRTYYVPFTSTLKRKSILDIENHGPGVKDLAWSTAVQYGAGSTSIFEIPLKNLKEKDDKMIINLVSDYKKKTVETWFKSSSSLWPGLRSRFSSEQTDLLKLADSGAK